MTHYLQNRIAQSRWTFHFTALYALVVCLAAGLIGHNERPGLWAQLIFLAVSSLLMIELNNANALIRIYSRSVSCSYLIMAVMASFLFAQVEMSVLQFSAVAFLVFFFKAYQDDQATGTLFYAFSALGLASIVWVQVLYFLPVLWVLLATNIQAFSARTFFASLLGVLMPYWFYAAYLALMGHVADLLPHFVALLEVGRPFVGWPTDGPRLVVAAFVVAIALLSSIHFLIYSYLDKIRTRMLYETLITLEVCEVIFAVLQPQHFDALLSLFIVTLSPVAGHWIALSNNRLSNITFQVIIASTVIITSYVLWNSSPIFS